MNANNTSDREIIAERVFDAPRELVWKVWTDPNHIAHWWGPNGFTNTIQNMDVKQGGIWKFVMHGPDGVDYNNEIQYLEVIPPEKLVYKHGSGGDDHPGFHVTVLFQEDGKKTKLSMQLIFRTAEEKNEIVERSGEVDGLSQTLEKLRGYLANL